MEITVILSVCLLHLTFADTNDKLQFGNNNEKFKTYQLEVPGKEPITIIESEPKSKDLLDKWDVTETTLDNDSDIKNLMTHIIYDANDNKPRCYGPSCQEGFIEDEGPQQDFEDFVFDNSDKLKDFSDFSDERLQAIAALAAKLKRNKIKDRFPSSSSQDDDNEDKVFTSWNRLKVKQHKHPYDDKDGWVTLEPVAWSTSKISKWKPNVKKQKPAYWNDEDDNKYHTNNNDKYQSYNDDKYHSYNDDKYHNHNDDKYHNHNNDKYHNHNDDKYHNHNDDKYHSHNDDRYSTYQDMDNSYVYPQKQPSMTRPGFINNKLHVPQEYDTELPSKPSWTKNKLQHSMQSFHSSWSPDESRRPYKPNCDKNEGYPNDDSAYYGMSDSIMTDSRPSHFPYEYEALHQSPTQKRPLRRPTQVVYADDPDIEDDRSSRPPYGDGQWVLLSTTKGYRNKKRQRSLDPPKETKDVPSIVSHQSVSLTVLPADDSSPSNMTTSHGGLLEVEKSFQTVEESKRDMDLKNDLEVSASHQRPIKHKLTRKKLFGHKNTPDSSTVLAAVGAGMVPATMAMVVPMMLGRRRKRDVDFKSQILSLDDLTRFQFNI